MKVLGVHLTKNDFRYAVMEGSKTNPSLIKKDKVITIKNASVPELMNWYDDNFKRLIERHNPDKISYRLTLNPNKEQLFNLEFPYGLLNLIAYEKEIDIREFTSQSYTPSKLDLNKGSDLYEYCDTVLGDNKPYWDKTTKYAVLAAWFEL
ncbi:conserved protein of unknown function [Petrocella atlantisensis]|uniref:Uncharacterized protein n=1 Tax=Petrocella atlantisensis TaxID=2173034 RepID=A0A3P7PQR2_9FIRM|nr:hypothetical protein [Petrocella atlantisensis]VDN46707.1 conserved protein of unknown function [Petrocella atlantisensis]